MTNRHDGRNLFRSFALVAAVLFLSVNGNSQTIDIDRYEASRILVAAARYLSEAPMTITAIPSPRSAGGIHDYFSEGDYWWPDPADSSGPYLQRDGLTNPENFVAHRQALIRFSVQEATLAAAYRITGDEKFAVHAIRHLRAWFVDPATRMAPHLRYAQAIRGRATGRGIGIIDTIHLIEVAKSIGALNGARSLEPEDLAAIKRWFEDYLAWLTTSPYGKDEREARNNHGTCWVLQVAAFAELLGDSSQLEYCRWRFKEKLLPSQMALDGSFPLELARTKPYGYSIFNLDAFAGICQILSSPRDNLFAWTLPDGRGIRKAMEWLYPYLEDKSRWPFARDVMYFDAWPVRQPALLFAAEALGEKKYLDLWKKLGPDPAIDEVIRNFPIRQPVLWLNGNTISASLDPEVLLMDPGSLRRARELGAGGEREIDAPLRRLYEEAGDALHAPPASVVMKSQVPPSGDRHDYMSLAPYWWPDVRAPRGSPYVRRDGEINPEREDWPDRRHWISVSSNVQTLGLAYYCSGDERYAKHAVLLLRTWFLDDSTRMNPNLNYGQRIQGVNEGRGAGIIEFRSFPDLLDAVKLLERSRAWTPRDRREFRRWCEAYLQWLQMSANGKQEAAAKNNHGTWYDVQVARTALFLGADSLARALLATADARRIGRQILPDGSQPLELERTKSWGYSLLNLEGLVALAMLGERVGVDLWRFATADGRSIRKAIDFLIPYAGGGQIWKFRQIVPLDRARLYPILLVARARYGEERFARAAAKLRDSETSAMRANITFGWQNSGALPGKPAR